MLPCSRALDDWVFWRVRAYVGAARAAVVVGVVAHTAC